ncbi:hypothetical protein AM588_10007178 [Phytophthora nicotianae]|uniref:EamA domain-containing protein n=1 Tax=Phytophthora nicotianae TaxID=4792 RepID=A0A0W8D8D0_PHYNI|nr:hypothetical protein AM588_10007178 [Phytophthora nicotianae]
MSKRLAIQLPAFARVAVLLSLYSLDLLDLHAKIAWIGTSESFSFDVVHHHSFENDPLARPEFPSANESLPTTELGTELLRVSGWTSLYERCSDLYATKDNEEFDMIKAINCELGPQFSTERRVADELILSATLNVDSVAWVSCQLLFFHRRPPLCQENVVTLFSTRYRLTEDEVDPDKMAPIHSIAEAELLRMLDLLSRSHPLSNVVCAQGFEATAGPGRYDTDVFACGSPNVLESAFIGVFASNFGELHADLAQLAVDEVNIMGFELISRQNSRSQFILKEKNGEVVVVEENMTNFATFGHLYVFLILVDFALLIAHARATFDTGRMFGWRTLIRLKDAENNDSDNFGDSSWLLLYRSLYRSGPIAALTILSALISWFVNLPFALMWCTASEGKVYALVSAVRVWMLVLCLLNLLWGACVLHERIDIPSFACALLSFGGLLCVVRPAFIFGNDHATAHTDGSWIAIGSALLGAIGQAFVFISVRKLKSIHFLVIVHYFMLFSVIGSLLYMVLVQRVFVVPSTTGVWLAVIGSGVFTFVGQMLLTKGFQLEKAGIASVMRYLDVVCVFMWDYLLLGEKINYWSVVGAAIICTCAATIALRKAHTG